MDIIVLKPTATEEELRHITKKLESRGLNANISKGTERTIIGVIGDTSKITEEEEDAIRAMSGVEEVMRILKPYKLASFFVICLSSSSVAVGLRTIISISSSNRF